MEDHLTKYIVYNRTPKHNMDYEAMKTQKKEIAAKGIMDKRLLLLSPELGKFCYLLMKGCCFILQGSL